MPPDLRQRWDEAAAGNRDAFAEFYVRHANRLYSHCLRRLESIEDAQDATEEAFAAALARPWKVRYVDGSDIFPWLIVTANNVCHEYERRRKRERDAIAISRPALSESDQLGILSARDAEEDSIELAVAILYSLSPRDRQIIEMCVIHGIKPQVLADGTISAGTVRSRLSRALARARHRYDEQHFGATFTDPSSAP